MFTFTTADVHTIEHNLRTDRANLFGWLQETTSGSQRPAGSSAVISRLIKSMFSSGQSRRVELPASDDMVGSAMSHLHGAA